MMKSLIIWDLGSTKCAAAKVLFNTETETYQVETEYRIRLIEVKSLAELADRISEELGVKLSDADAICIGGAGQYDGETLHHVRPYPYPMNVAKVAKSQNWPKFVVVHDYTPIICATFTQYLTSTENVKWLRQGQMHPYGRRKWIHHEGQMHPHGRRVVLGVGTGLGLKDGILLPDGRFWLGINEIGHIGVCRPPLAQPDYRDRDLQFTRALYSQGILKQGEPLTFEKILSGHGLARMHRFATQSQHNLKPKEISELIQSRQADDTLAIFAWYLGLFVGTVQLIFMPAGGIYITGGVVLKNLLVFDHPDFYQGIYASPGYEAERATFPLGVMVNPQHAYIGGAFYAAKRLLGEDMGLGLMPGVTTKK